jgi:glycogenin
LPAAGEAWATLLTDGEFLPGLEVLVHSLRKHAGAPRPLLVMWTPASFTAVDRVRLRRLAERATVACPRLPVLLHSVPPIAIPGAPCGHVPAWAAVGYTKLNLWGLRAWRKVVYLDADTLVRACIDDLFARPGSPRPAAAPDVFPPDRFNAGVLVVEPCARTFTRLLAAARVLPTYDGGDTGLLNAAFPDWFTAPPAFRLPFGDNAQRTMHWLTYACVVACGWRGGGGSVGR